MTGLKVLAFSLFILSGCCPKITPFIETRTEIEYRDTVIVIPARSDTFDIDLRAICDSLFAGRPVSLMVEGPAKDRGKTRAGITVTKDGKAQIVCHEQEWIARFDSLLQTKTITITETITKEVNRPFRDVLLQLLIAFIIGIVSSWIMFRK